MNVSRAGFLKGLMAAFLTPVAAKAAYVNPYTQPTRLKDLPPVEKVPEVKLDDYYEKSFSGIPLSGVCYGISGVADGLYESIYSRNKKIVFRGGNCYLE